MKSLKNYIENLVTTNDKNNSYMVNGLIIDKLLTVDDTGMPKAPTLRQLQDKDVLLLWQRDTSKININI